MSNYAQVKIDTKQLDNLSIVMKDFVPNAKEAEFQAIKRTVQHVKTQICQTVPKYYTIKSRDVKATLKANQPSRKNLSASIESHGRRLTFVHFQLSPRSPLDKNKSYKVKVKIKRDSGKKVVNTNPKPFVASTGAKNIDRIQYNIFKREGKGRKPIHVLHTLSIPQMITNEQVSKVIQESAESKMIERYEHEISRQIQKANSKIKKG